VTDTPIKLAIAGAGGFAEFISDLALREGENCQPRVQLVGVAEPDTTTHAARLASLRQRGVRTTPNFDELLADPAIEAVWLPLPIHLHRPFAERALAAGKAVMTEKPVAGAVQDVDAMIAARDRAGKPAAVGFQHVYDPATALLKRWLIEGRIGTIRHATLHACWPRAVQYFQRNRWAGRCRLDGQWVMDSPANNALSHFVNLALFMLGPSLAESAPPQRIEAELYRAHAVENFDTISARAHLAGGVTLLALMTHACAQRVGPILRIEGTHGSLAWSYEQIEVTSRGTTERIVGEVDSSKHMLERFARLVRGLPDERRLVSTLETARAQVLLVNAASEATPIVPVLPAQIRRFDQDGFTWVAIEKIEEVMTQCAARQQMLHESGQLPFTRPSGSLETRDYRQFAGPKT